jgi:hypothetical protein
MSPYVIKFGFRFAERWKYKGGEDTATASTDTTATEQ